MLVYSLPVALLVSTLFAALRARRTATAAPSRPGARKRGTVAVAHRVPARRFAVTLMRELLLEEAVALIAKVLVPAAIMLLVALGVSGAANLPLEGLDKVREQTTQTEPAHPAPTTVAVRYIYVPYERP